MPYSTFQIVGSLNLTWGGEVFAAATSFSMFLSTTDPGADGTGRTEPVGLGYAQITITNNTTNWPSIVASPKVNGADFQFAPASGSWGTITHAGFDDQSGNYIGGGALTASRTITSGDIVLFPAGSVSIAMS